MKRMPLKPAMMRMMTNSGQDIALEVTHSCTTRRNGYMMKRTGLALGIMRYGLKAGFGFNSDGHP
jgi:hypothetical protein